MTPDSDAYASQAVDRILHAAARIGASDVHLTQRHQTLTLQFRVDGRLISLPDVPSGTTTSIPARIKALARLITYRQDVPQEGRLVFAASQDSERLEARVSTLPTLHGERLVIRLAQPGSTPRLPQDLGLPQHVLPNFLSALNQPSGVVLIAGTAGAGKTTSAYAAIRHLLQSNSPKSIVTLEDPIECELEGTAQSQINAAGDYDWSSGLKAILRQDPEAMLIGEIRDAQTAAVVFQAAMTGQLVITTLHARSAVDALQRLLDMGVTYQRLRGGLRFLICQRLLPKLCVCQQQADHTNGRCEICGGSGTAGRMLLAEMLPEIEGEFAKAVAEHADSAALQAVALSLNMMPLATLAAKAVEAGSVARVDVSSSI